jgi:GNAT superfamily N-acetyltransferase
VDPADERPFVTRDHARMPTGGPSHSRSKLAKLERELHVLEEESQAVDADIAAVREASRHTPSGLRLEDHHEPPHPRVAGERVRLRDGATIMIRPIEPGDAAQLQHGLQHLSTLSRYHRFGAPITHFTRQQLEELTKLDHRTHEALGALDLVSGEGVGVARYIRDTAHPERAELFCTVIDAWQHRGVGRALTERLAARAREAGVEYFTASTLIGSEAARQMIADVLEPISEQRDGGIVRITARLPGSP